MSQKSLDELTIGSGTAQPFSTDQLLHTPNLERGVFAMLRSFRDAAIPQVVVYENLRAFASDLLLTWQEHNKLCDVIDAALANNADFESLATLYRRMIPIDVRKRHLSVSIKASLDRVGDYLKLRLLPDEFVRAFSLHAPSFWEEYGRNGSAPGSTDRYHRGSIELQQWRVANDPLLLKGPLGRSGGVRKDDLLYENRYHTLLQTVDDLLYIDNVCEPLWIKSLVGLPDFYLRGRIAAVVNGELKSDINPFDVNALETGIRSVFDVPIRHAA